MVKDEHFLQYNLAYGESAGTVGLSIDGFFIFWNIFSSCCELSAQLMLSTWQKKMELDETHAFVP